MTKLSRLEGGSRGPKLEDVAGLLALYGVTGHAREELLDLCREVVSGERGWWQRRAMSEKQRTLIELEASATRIVNYESLLIPGLLQTGDYTRAVLRGMGVVPVDQIEDRLVTRLARHSVLFQEFPPELVAIVYEPALRQLVGGPGVMYRQLEYLLHAQKHPAITIRVVPFHSDVHPGLEGPFLKLELRDAAPVIFLGNRTSNLFLEDPAEIRVYNEVQRKLLNTALDTEESVQLISDLANGLRRGLSPVEENTNGQEDALGRADLAEELTQRE